MFVVGKEEMNKMDSYTIENEGLPGIVLMENAGERVAQEIEKSISHEAALFSNGKKQVLIFCGKGNNGGDGYVVGRKLIEKGWDVLVVSLIAGEKLQGDAKLHYQVYINKGYPIKYMDQLSVDELEAWLKKTHVIVDAMLGTGVKGKIREPYGQVITKINTYVGQKKIIAVDIPSGVCSDTGRVEDVAVHADQTVTFVLPKRGFFLPPGNRYVGKWTRVDISVDENLPAKLGFNAPRLITKELVRESLPKRDPFGHKGSFGHVLVVGGSKNMVGAPLYTTKAALHSGSGLVTLATPEVIYRQASAQLPGAMYLPLEEMNGFFAEESIYKLKDELDRFDVVAIGPGLGRWKKGKEWLKKVLQSANEAGRLKSMVLDADALFLLAEQKHLIQEAEVDIICTPHPGEMATLLETSVKEIESNRMEYAQKFSTTYKVFTLLKGAASIISSPEGEVYINNTGNDGLAKGGSGDVLTGIIAAFTAQGATPLHALIAAVYLHGHAADQLLQVKSSYCMQPDDIIDQLGSVIMNINSG